MRQKVYVVKYFLTNEETKWKKKHTSILCLLEKKMGTLSSIPDWEIPWTEKPGRDRKSSTRFSD